MYNALMCQTLSPFYSASIWLMETHSTFILDVYRAIYAITNIKIYLAALTRPAASGYREIKVALSISMETNCRQIIDSV